MIEIDNDTLSYATVRQLEYIEALGNAKGDIEKAAKALGVCVGTITRSIRILRERAARKGIAPGHFNSGVAPGYAMGKVTVQRGKDGNIERTWERQSPGELSLEQLQQFFEGLASSMSNLAKPVKAPTRVDKDLMVVVPIGDPHFGMKAWAEDAGDHFDLETAERLTCSAIDRLVDTGPLASQALLLNLGDHFHADNQSNRTSSGNQLDVDGRWAEIQQVGLRAMIYSVDQMLKKYPVVIVRINPGNHDSHSARALAMMLKCWYRNEPRVRVEISPALHWYMTFGSNLIGSTHGDTTKGQDLMGVMAADRPTEWGQTKHRYWYVGHVHHKFAKEYPGGIVEYVRTLAAGDAWHRGQGYRSGRDMQLIVHHWEHGEIERHRCDIGMLTA